MSPLIAFNPLARSASMQPSLPCSKSTKVTLSKTAEGLASKPHEGYRPGNTNHITTGVTPKYYLEIVSSTDSKTKEKHPMDILNQWTAANDQHNFSVRAKQGEEVHGSNPMLRFMKEHYIKTCHIRPAKDIEKPSRTSNTISPVMVPETVWETAEVEKATNSMRDLQIINFHQTMHRLKEPPEIQIPMVIFKH